MPRRNGLPPYRLHKATGQALVHVGGRDVYLGLHGSDDSKARYEEICRGVLLERAQATAKADAERRADRIDGLTVRELVAKYVTHARGYYRKHGRQTSEFHAIRSALRPVREHFPDTAAGSFGPSQLKSIREHWIARGIVREQINKRAHRIRRMFAWGIEEELILPGVIERLAAVAPLKKNRTTAKEGTKVLPVPEAAVEATLPLLNRHIRAMVEIQRLTGARPGEICLMRTADLDMSGDVWLYRPGEHKTEHHEHDRVIVLGPRAIALIKPWLRADRDEYLFSPIEAEAERHSRQRQRRATPLYPSHMAHQARKRVRRPRRMPGAYYGEHSYRRAITKAIVRENRRREGLGIEPIEMWHPHQLRHAVATRVEREYSLEHAKSCLGHTSVAVTAGYVAKDLGRAKEVMRQIG